MTGANKRAIEVVLDYIKELESDHSWKNKKVLAQWSYSIWAAEEILDQLRSRRKEAPLWVLEDFVLKMDTYACYSRSNSFMFSVAADTGKVIIDELLA